MNKKDNYPSMQELKIELIKCSLAILIGLCGLIYIAMLHYKLLNEPEALFLSVIVCILLIVWIPLFLSYEKTH